MLLFAQVYVPTAAGSPACPPARERIAGGEVDERDPAPAQRLDDVLLDARIAVAGAALDVAGDHQVAPGGASGSGSGSGSAAALPS